MATSKFLETGVTYIDNAATYLEERCLTIEDVNILPFCTKNHGLSTEGGAPYLLEGWAMVLRGPDGLPKEGEYLLRVCNYPKEPLFMKRGKMAEVWKDRPKFLQTFKGEFLHFTRPLKELCRSPVIMIHEKITSAELATKNLDIPCLALSGCQGWSSKGALAAGLRKVLSNLQEDCKVIVCFDGDMQTNHNIMQAAEALRGWLSCLRADLTVTFPAVPENDNGVGWDDWAVAQGDDLPAIWGGLLTGEGVEISDFIPAGFLIEEFQLEVKETREGTFAPKHTLDNYRRLLRYPKWVNLGKDISGLIYDRNDIDAGPQSLDMLCDEYQIWLERGAYRGDSEAVRSSQIRRLMETHVERNEFSVPIVLLEREPVPTYTEAHAAAVKLITQGIYVHGPLDQAQTAETIMRMARDIVAMWTTDQGVDTQWACALVGPTGCGKSNFPHSFLRCFQEWGYRGGVAKLEKTGPRAELTELYRTCRDSMLGVFDEYNPDDRCAQQVEQNIFTLSTTRTTFQRRSHKEESVECMRHASLFLTTTDTNRKYIRSSKGAGERRFITLEVRGVKPHADGVLSSDRDVIAECGKVLLTYGLDLYKRGDSAPATQYTITSTSSFISDSATMDRVAQFWARGDLHKVLGDFRAKYFRLGRPGVDQPSVRFTAPLFYELLLPNERLSRIDKSELRNLLEGSGAEMIGKARVNGGPYKEGTMKDEVWVVENWEGFVEELTTKI